VAEAPAPSSVKEAIDFAILHSNRLQPSAGIANLFEIARNGQRVATIRLARSAYRLGDTVVAAVDFCGVGVPCYAFRVMLETAEMVDPTIALRSKASIHRVTRRSHAVQTEPTLFARRVVCSLAIPLQATPSFITSGVSLNWNLRFEFVASRAHAPPPPAGQRQRMADLRERDESSGPDGSDEADAAQGMDLLEELARDERGSLLAAVEVLPCDVFDVTIPLRVYGPVSDDTGGVEWSSRDGWSV
jgi:hypothetical protein